MPHAQAPDQVDSKDKSDLEDILARFDRSWRSGTAPRIEDFQVFFDGRSPSARRILLEELVTIDLQYHWQQKSPPYPRLEDYAGRFPDLGPAPQLSLELVRWEYWARRCWGDHPGHEEYAARFPHHGAARAPGAARGRCRVGRRAVGWPESKPRGRGHAERPNHYLGDGAARDPPPVQFSRPGGVGGVVSSGACGHFRVARPGPGVGATELADRLSGQSTVARARCRPGARAVLASGTPRGRRRRPSLQGAAPENEPTGGPQADS